MESFPDPLHEEFATWALGFAPFGGADLGEVAAISTRVIPGDDASYFTEWSTAADAHLEAGEAAEARGGYPTAHEEGLRAACFYGVAMHVVYGAPTDPRMRSAFASQSRAFALAMRTRPDPAERLEVPFQGDTMPAYFVPAVGMAGSRRPLIILTNGYDATMADMYLGMAVSATRRGFHCLLFDGPGQGAMLVEKGVPLRADWENVVTPVVDAAVARDDVEAGSVVLQGWSLGGYLAPRAASGEPRLAALVADPGSLGMAESLPLMGRMLGLSRAAVADLPDISEADAKAVLSTVTANRKLEWTILKRGYWVGGVDSLPALLRSMMAFTLEGRFDAIRCPTLLTAAEADPLSRDSDALAAKLNCPTTVISFTSAEGAGDHCELLNRTLANRRIYDWVEETLAG